MFLIFETPRLLEANRGRVRMNTQFQCRRTFFLQFIEKISIFGFLLCSDGKQNTDASLEDNADAKFMFSWIVDVGSTNLAQWKSSEDELKSGIFMFPSWGH